MALVDSSDLISITEATQLGISAPVRAVEGGCERIILRNNKPVAAIVSMDRLELFQQLQEDLVDLSLATARMLTTGAERHSLDEVLTHFGYTRDELREMPELTLAHDRRRGPDLVNHLYHRSRGDRRDGLGYRRP